MTAALLGRRAARALPRPAPALALAPLLLSAVALRYSLGGPLPPGDGGLFYLIGRQLAASFPRLPAHVHFSGMDLPVGYPPLGFYLAALLAKAGMPLDEAMRYLPLAAVLATAGVAALLLRELASSQAAAALAALLLVGLPRFWAGQLAGGGITRAPGLLLCLVAWLLAARARGRQRPVLLAGAAAGLALLFHPEMGVYAVAGLAFLVLLRAPAGERRRALLQAAAGAAAAALSAPWWGWVVAQHGAGLLVGAAAGSQGGWELRFLAPLLPPVYGEAVPWPVSVIVMAGAVAAAVAAGKRWPLVMALWLVLADPRKGTVVATLPLALGAGEALAALVRGSERATFLLTGCLAALSLWSGLTARTAPTWPLEKVAAGDVAAMRAAGGEGGTVLVLSGVQWARDSWSDWGPALSGREYLLTVQGSEWLGGKEFGARRERYRQVQECAAAGDVACLEGWLGELRPAAVWVLRTCPCPGVEEWLRQRGAVAAGNGVYLVGGRDGARILSS